MTAAAAVARVDVVHGHGRARADDCGAYHGILARGLEAAGVDPAEWPALAPRLDHVLRTGGAATPELAALLDAAEAEGVLPYATSAAIAARFVRRLARDHDRLAELAHSLGADVGADGAPERAELWSVREGHTSSVWRVELNATAWEQPLTFAIDLARGSGAAADELMTVARELQRMHAADPQRVNRVLALERVEREDGAGDGGIPLVVSDWLEGARELHVAPDGTWIAAESFDGQAPRGEPADSDACWTELVDLTVTHSYARDGSVQRPAFEPNDGDLVAHNGRIRAVAASAPPAPLPLGQWVAACLLPSARCATGPVVWPRLERALEVLAAAADRNERLPSATDCIGAAIEFTSGHSLI